MEDFVTFLIGPLLQDPTQIKIRLADTALIVTLLQTDLGKVIGKHGQAIFHLRTLIKTYCKLHHLPPAYLQIQEL